MKGYIYNIESMELTLVLVGNQDAIENYAQYSIDTDTHALTYSPAFGSIDGVIETNDYETIEV